jgi:hypothetical protein
MNRRLILEAVALGGVGAALATTLPSAVAEHQTSPASTGQRPFFVTAKGGLFVQDAEHRAAVDQQVATDQTSRQYGLLNKNKAIE